MLARAALALLVWLGATAAHAQPSTDAGLVWQAPVSCPNIDEVRARIERRLGSSIDRAIHGVAVDVARDGDGGGRFVARIDLRAVTVANEIRVLTSARCDELADAVAVVIARIAAENRQVSAERSQPTRIALPAPPPVVPDAWGSGLRALGVSGVGALPGIGVGGELAGHVRHRSLFAELAGAMWARSPKVVAQGAPGRVDVSLKLAALRIGWDSEQLPLRAWLSGELGLLEGTGVAFDGSRTGAARWLAAGAEFGVGWPMTEHTRLIGVVELAVPLERARFVLRGGSSVFSPEVATARCGFGLEVGWR